MAEPQRADESPFDYLARLQAEHARTKPLVAQFRRWRFKGRKPNGKWWAWTGWGFKAQDVFADTVEALIEAVSQDCCIDCGHRWARHDGEKCTGWRGNGGGRVACECTKKAPVAEAA